MSPWRTTVTAIIRRSSNSARIQVSPNYADATAADYADAAAAAGHEFCSNMWIPVTLTLTTEDGLLNEVFDTEVATLDGVNVGVVLEPLRAQELHGSFSRALPPDSTVDLSLGTENGEYYQGVWVGTGGDFLHAPLLWGVAPFGLCPSSGYPLDVDAGVVPGFPVDSGTL
jgi:hypothetical protein